MGYSLGIDLGTTFTAAAVFRDGKTEMVSLGNRAASIPSLVFLRDDESILTGDAAERRGLAEPSRLARQFKRRVGDATPIMLGGTPYSAERLMAALLTNVLATVAEREGGPPDAVAISHPANWGPYKIDLIRQAAQLASIGSATLLTEPVAAAINYAATERVEPGETVAVYDLGGGTFDAAVLRRTQEGFEPLGQPEGIERLGGIDFDEAVFNYVRTALDGQIEELDTDDPAVRSALARLREECTEAKEALSTDTDTAIPIMLPSLQTDVRLTRPEFEGMIRPTLRETIDALHRAIESAAVQREDLRAVLLVGGSSRVPLVAEMVSNELGRPVAVDTHPKHAVALGAAIVAAQQAGDYAAAPPAAAVAPPPQPAAPEPEPTVAAAAAVGGAAGPATEPTPAAAPPGPPTEPLRAPGPPGGGGSRRGLWIGGGVAALVVIVVVVVVVLAGGGGNGDGDTQTIGDGEATEEATEEPTEAVEATPTTEATEEPTEAPAVATPTPTEPPAPTCLAPEGLCVSIDGIVLDGSTYVATYSTVGYTPRIVGGGDPAAVAGDHHIHFFFDTVSLPQNAGTNGNPPGSWVVWDLAAGGGQPIFNGFTTADALAVGASQLCAVVANEIHQVLSDAAATGNCVPLPA